jgi:hypothetical protein
VIPTALASSFKLSPFCMTCDVASTAVFCSESTECSAGMASKFFKPSVTILVAPFITGIVLCYVFHIRCISVHNLLYLTSFLLPFTRHFTSVSMHVFSFLFLIIITGLFAVTSLSVCTA